MFQRWHGLGVLIVFLLLTGPAIAQAGTEVLVVVDAPSRRSVEASGLRAKRIVEVPSRSLELAERLIGEINAGKSDQDGLGAPSSLDAFSASILKAIPDLLERRSIIVVTSRMLPLEMVRAGDVYLGDIAEISHEFPLESKAVSAPPPSAVLPMWRYVVEAVIEMEKPAARADQDIVKVALELESEIQVELSFGGGKDRFRQALGRRDVSILHVDTHGGPEGRSIQVSRQGSMLEGAVIEHETRIPLILLFGCEAAASQDAFGAVLHQRGARAVISAFAKFNSFGLTGAPDTERLIYDAFFSALRDGRTVNAALLAMRQAALHASRTSRRAQSLTRLTFILIGHGNFSFDWPKLSASARN